MKIPSSYKIFAVNKISKLFSLVVCLLLGLPKIGYAQQLDTLKANTYTTNNIVPITYPPLSVRDGKGLQLPIPITEHPRLYLTQKDIPALREKINIPLLKTSWERILQASTHLINGLLSQEGTKQNFDVTIRNAIEAKALLYLFSNDTIMGRQAINALLNFYATLHFDLSKQDVCREVGRTIVTGAMVYDWCYPIATTEEKIILIGRMETLATQLEIEWPKLLQGSVTGHGVEAQLSRDMLSCGVATYNEKPEIYNLAAGRIMAEFVPVRKFFYPAAYHHQGSAYGPYRFAWDMYPTLIFDKIGYPNIFGTHQANALYYFIYSRRPDGQLFRNGDEFNELFSPFGKYWSLGGSANLFTGSYFKDVLLMNEAVKENNIGKGSDYLFDFLFFNNIVTVNATKASLPLTKYFKQPFGAMIARTSWDEGLLSSSAMAEMKIGVHNFVNHQHLDAGSFQLYYKGPLTINSGIYQGNNSSYGGEHFINYYQRSIAHNTMLVYYPNEKFTWHNKDCWNDGGQRWPNNGSETKNLDELLQKEYETGEVLAHAFGPDSLKPQFSYLKGNLAPAYSNKVKKYTRSFVFLNFENANIPAALIVFDNLTAASKDFKKYWLLHTVQEPVVDGITTTAIRNEKGYDGKMINTTLLPLQNNLVVNKIGGTENKYHVFGKNFPNEPVNKANSVDSATWRIEVSPKLPAAQNLFLNVLQVMHSKLVAEKAYHPVKIETNQFVGTQIGDRVVLFHKQEVTVNEKFKVTIKGKGNFKILIVDVQEGDWEIVTAKRSSIVQHVEKDAQLLYFNGKAGEYSFTKIK